jgi:hypothetical protein
MLYFIEVLNFTSVNKKLGCGSAKIVSRIKYPNKFVSKKLLYL